jgi:hypothetical protein
MKNWPRWRNLKLAIASQSHRTCVADSSSSRHLSQVRSSVNPKFERCPFRWQCPVNSPTTHLNWYLFNFNRFFVLLADGLDMSPFACLSPVMDSHCFVWFLFIQSLIALLTAPIKMPQADWCPVNRCSDPVLASRSAVSFPAVPSLPGTHISWTLLYLASGNPRRVLKWTGICALIATWLSNRI